MRTAKHLFPQLCDPDQLEAAAHATLRGKRRRPDVAWFIFRFDAELERLRSELTELRYKPERPELVSIRDPKPRLISRIPIADRVVQTALVQLMEPIFLRRLRPESYACRPEMGTHRAVLRLLEYLRRHRFVLHLDIRSYFPSIDTTILRELIERYIRDESFMEIVGRVLAMGSGLYDTPAARTRGRIDTDWPPRGHGLPIGAYTSQLFAAHVYLADLDHRIKRKLKIPGYVRYVDDFFLFANSRAELRNAREDVRCWLNEKRHLRLKHPKARVLSCRGHLDALGYCLTRTGIQPLPRALKRLERRAAAELVSTSGRQTDVEFGRSLAASAGVLLF